MALDWLRAKAFFIATWSYNGGLHHYTLRPIAQLAEHQDDPTRVTSLLYEFRLRKEQEMRFIKISVRIALTLAGSLLNNINRVRCLPQP